MLESTREDDLEAKTAGFWEPKTQSSCSHTSPIGVREYTTYVKARPFVMAGLSVQGCVCADFHHPTAKEHLSLLRFVCLHMSHAPVCVYCTQNCDLALHVLASVYLLGMLSTSHLCTLPLSPARQERLT